MSVPERPALSAHVFARRHVVDGKDLVVLHDTENLVSHRLGQRAWTVAAAMDGTRDVVGIVERCRQEGVVATEDEVRAFVAELWSTGLVGEGATSRSFTSRASRSTVTGPGAAAASTRRSRALSSMRRGRARDCRSSARQASISSVASRPCAATTRACSP